MDADRLEEIVGVVEAAEEVAGGIREFIIVYLTNQDSKNKICIPSLSCIRMQILMGLDLLGQVAYYFCGACCVFDQLSRKETVLLNTRAPGAE